MSKTAEEHNCDMEKGIEKLCRTCIHSDECSTYHDLDKPELGIGLRKQMAEAPKEYPYHKFTKKFLKDVMKDLEFKGNKPHPIMLGPQSLLEADDDMFTMLWNLDNITILTGTEGIKLLNERAKKLGLKLIDNNLNLMK